MNSIIPSENKKVRIHTRITSEPWAIIWYTMRGLDKEGRGEASAALEELVALTGKKSSTLYELLRRGREVGAFRKYQKEGESMRIILGSLESVCISLKLNDWGAVGEIDMTQVKDIRRIACEIETQRQQQKSQFAVRRALSRQERESLELKEPLDLVGRTDTPNPDIDWKRGATGKPTSLKSHKPQIHRGPQRIFVNESFIPFGVSQAAIAQTLGVSERTVGRYLEGVQKKQLMQYKPAYGVLAESLKYGQTSTSNDSEVYLTELRDGSLRLYEPYGTSNAVRPGGHPVTEEKFSEEYFGVIWIHRCNLYILNHELKSMKYARNRLKKLMAKSGRRTVPV